MEPEDDIDPSPADPKAAGANAPILIYTRTETVVSRYSGTAKATAHAGVGTMLVGGHIFDTFERLDGYVALKGNQQYVCKMEYSPSKFWPPKSNKPRKQIRPLNHGSLKRGGGLAAILIHPGAYPSSFIGCIGVGKRDGNELKETGESMAKLLELCGGFKVGRKVQLVVIGNKPRTPT